MSSQAHGSSSSSSHGSRGGGGGGGGGGGDGGVYGPSGGDATRAQQTRHARRLYVGGLPPGSTEDDLLRFFTNAIQRATAPHGLPPDMGPAVLQTYINPDKFFGFVELATMELTASCLGLNGVRYDSHLGSTTLRVRRPNDFKPELVPLTMQPLSYFNLSNIEIAAGAAPGPMLVPGAPSGPRRDNTTGRVFIGGLPYHLTDDEVKELLGAFGPIRDFNLVRDPGSVTSKGYAFVEYLDHMSTETAIAGLHGLPLAGKTLTVRMAGTQGTDGGAPAPAATTQLYAQLQMVQQMQQQQQGPYEPPPQAEPPMGGGYGW